MLIKVFNTVFWVITHLAGFGCLLLAMISLSSPLLRKVPFHSRLERGVFTIATGAGISALLLFVLGLVGLLTRGIVISGIAIGCLAVIISHVRQSWKRQLAELGRVCGKNKLLVLMAVSYWLLLLMTTQYPPMDWDATMYHLVLAEQYLSDGKILTQPGVIFPVLPLLNHMLFVAGMALYDDILAQMVEHLFLMLIALGLYAWGLRQQSSWLGLTAAAFWLSHPLILWLAESAYVDIGLTCFAFLGVYAIRVFWDEGSAAWWGMGIALLSFATGSKFPGMVFLACALGLGLIAWWKSRLDSKQIIFGVFLAAALALPWYAFIAAVTRNPFWPMFAQYSAGIWADKSIARSMRVWIDNVGVPKTPLNFLLIPFSLIFNPAPFLPDNRLALFPLVSGWVIAWGVAWWNRSVRWWSLWALLFTAFWFSSSQQVRLWTPAVPLVSLAFCESFQWLGNRVTLLRTYGRWISALFILMALSFGGGAVGVRLWAKGFPPTNPTERETYIRSFWGHFPAVEYVNKNLAGNEAVYVIQGSWLNYYFNTRIVDASGILQQVIQPSFSWPTDERWIKWLENQNVGWIMANKQSPALASLAQRSNPEIWPGWKLVYSDTTAWVFRRMPSAATP